MPSAAANELSSCARRRIGSEFRAAAADLLMRASSDHRQPLSGKRGFHKLSYESMETPFTTGPPLIDIEASGLHPTSYPIEVAVRVNGTMHSWLIRPEQHWTHWDEEAERLHGLSRELLHREGLSADVVAEELNSVFSGPQAIVYSDVAHWDDAWLTRLFDAAAVQRRVEVRPIQGLLSVTSLAEFQLALPAIQRANETRRHRAAADVELLLQAFLQAIGTR